MEVEATRRDRQAAAESSPHTPLPFMERLVLGAIGGAGTGILAAAIAFEMELRVFAGLVLAPLLGTVGACCGVISRCHGWAAVRPLVWAIAGGVVLHIDRPAGWVLGGAIGGVINGILGRSIARTARAALLGAGLGVLGWAIVYGCLLGSACVLDWLDG